MQAARWQMGCDGWFTLSSGKLLERIRNDAKENQP
jgi:hypothetical protein